MRLTVASVGPMCLSEHACIYTLAGKQQKEQAKRASLYGQGNVLAQNQRGRLIRATKKHGDR